MPKYHEQDRTSIGVFRTQSNIYNGRFFTKKASIVHFKHENFEKFSETFLGYKTITFYTSRSEADLTYLLPFASARNFPKYWKLSFKRPIE